MNNTSKAREAFQKKVNPSGEDLDAIYPLKINSAKLKKARVKCREVGEFLSTRLRETINKLAK